MSQIIFGGRVMHLNPPLYDFTEYHGNEIVRSLKGVYDYNRNLFTVPAKLKKMFEWKRKEDLDFMETIGLEWI